MGPPGGSRHRNISSNQAQSEDTSEPPAPVVLQHQSSHLPDQRALKKHLRKKVKLPGKKRFLFFPGSLTFFVHKEKPTEVALKVCILKGSNVCRFVHMCGHVCSVCVYVCVVSVYVCV